MRTLGNESHLSYVLKHCTVHGRGKKLYLLILKTENNYCSVNWNFILVGQLTTLYAVFETTCHLQLFFKVTTTYQSVEHFILPETKPKSIFPPEPQYYTMLNQSIQVNYRFLSSPVGSITNFVEYKLI